MCFGGLLYNTAEPSSAGDAGSKYQPASLNWHLFALSTKLEFILAPAARSVPSDTKGLPSLPQLVDLAPSHSDEATTDIAAQELVIKDRADESEMKHCRLLSLPKELRLMIWKWTVTDPSSDRLIVRISRKYPVDFDPPRKRHCLSDYYRRADRFTGITTTFVPSDYAANTSLLRANGVIYQEALPLLYHATCFSISDTNGVFPIFLSKLSEFAKQQLRYVGLDFSDYVSCPMGIQHRWHPRNLRDSDWVFTCAQIAGLPSLRRIELVGRHVFELPPHSVKHQLLWPLLRT